MESGSWLRKAGPCALIVLLGLGTAAAQNDRRNTGDDAGGAAPPPRSLRATFDQPVRAFIWGPASLLLLPDERITYIEEAGARFQREAFIDQFWSGMARYCPQPDMVRDLFWDRVEEATAAYPEEGVPGWITDRGRFHVLIGPPTSTEETVALVDEREQPVLVWRWEDREEEPRAVTFRRDGVGWEFLRAGEPPAGEELPELAAGRIEPALEPLVADFRRGCEPTPELAWRAQLWELTASVLAGDAAGDDQDVEPSWYFFPADEGATFGWMSVPLDRTLAEDEQLVALMRLRDAPDEEARLLGSDDFPFELREVAGRRLAQAGRVVEPGRYAVALAVRTADGEVEPVWLGEQPVAQFSGDELRFSSVLLARSVQPLEQAEPKYGPFRVAGFEVVPREGSSIRHGEELTVFYQVVGAELDESQRADLAVTYQFHIKPQGRGWTKAGQPVASSAFGTTQAWSTPIVEQWPEADYKLEIVVEDRRTGEQVTTQVPFSVQAP
jgi:GWxTD domain-containing protein